MDNSNLKKINVDKLIIATLFDVGSRISPCWKYFGNLILCDGLKRKMLNSDYVFCAACLDAVKAESGGVTFGAVNIKSYNKSVSTGNLTRHLRDEHHIKDEGKKKIIKRDSHRGRTKAKATSAKLVRAKTEDILARDIALWLCTSLLPFDSICEEGMINFFKKYEVVANDDQLPSRNSIMGPALSYLFESLLQNVKDMINVDAPVHAAMTFDTWNDHHQQLNYASFSLHYLTTDFKLKAFTLRTQNIASKDPVQKLEEIINDIKTEYDLDNINIHAVTDSSIHLNHAVLQANMEQHLCLGRGLHNLVIIDGISSVPAVTNLVKRCKKIIKSIRCQIPSLENSGDEDQEQFFECLDKVAEQLQADENDPITQYDMPVLVKVEGAQELNATPSPSKDTNAFAVKTMVPSRWQIVLEIIETLMSTSNRDQINDILKRIGQNELKLTKSECNLLGELLVFLRRFRDVVEIMASPSTSTINVALVFRSEIIDILNSISDSESFVMLSLKRNMLTNVDKRFPVTKAMVAAALLDSRFICLNEVDSFIEANMTTKHSFLASYIKEVIDDSSVTSENKIKKEPEDTSVSSTNSEAPSILTKLSLKHSVGMPQVIPEDPIEQECWKYLASADPTEPKDGNLFAFWDLKKNTFPMVSELARSLLCVPATSSPSEIIFSEVGLKLSAKRLRLNPIKIDKILFIHDNYKTCKNSSNFM